MRNADQRPVNRQFMICIDEDELQFYLGLLTRLKAEDLLSEDDRAQAIVHLTTILALARDVTKGQAWSSQGE